jgi:hypothetical protein
VGGFAPPSAAEVAGTEARDARDEIKVLKERVHKLERKVQEIMRNLHYPDVTEH